MQEQNQPIIHSKLNVKEKINLLALQIELIIIIFHVANKYSKWSICEFYILNIQNKYF